jgi:hypothetical protein
MLPVEFPQCKCPVAMGLGNAANGIPHMQMLTYSCCPWATRKGQVGPPPHSQALWVLTEELPDRFGFQTQDMRTLGMHSHVLSAGPTSSTSRPTHMNHTGSDHALPLLRQGNHQQHQGYHKSWDPYCAAAAPALKFGLARRCSTSAASSTTGPLAVLTSTASGFIRRSCALLMRCRVVASRLQCRLTTCGAREQAQPK